MAQYTADRDCEIRCATGTPGKYVTIRLRAGETLVTDDPVVIAALDGQARVPDAQKGVTVLAQRPASPTHRVDDLPKEDLPTRGAAKERDR